MTNISVELPVAAWVYVSQVGAGEFGIRSGGFPAPTLLYSTFYQRSTSELGTESHDNIRRKLTEAADVNHLGQIADLLGKQDEIFSMIGVEFAKYAADKNLPQELMRMFFAKAASEYRKFAFAEQSVRLEKLKELTADQLDLLEALKNPPDQKFIELATSYKKVHDASRSLTGSVSQASELYDANVKKLYGEAVLADLVKFGDEPQIIIPESQVSFVDGLELAASEVARDPVFVAGVRRRAHEAREDLGRLLIEITRNSSK